MYQFKSIAFIGVLFTALSGLTLFKDSDSPYSNLYRTQLTEFQSSQEKLIQSIQDEKSISPENISGLTNQIEQSRIKLKAIDFWLRYLQPVSYMKINGPLPVEWETEVFEKFETPYKRVGAGLSLAEIYLNEPSPDKDTLINLIKQSEVALETFQSDSMMAILTTPDHFFFANRLFLLNLSAIYTTGFECPDPSRIIPELQSMLGDAGAIYNAFNKSFPGDTLSGNYLKLYASMEAFVAGQNEDPNQFDHYHFIKDYVNPLYAINQHFIRIYHPVSKNYNDYSLNSINNSIFDKNLYKGQNEKGIFIAVNDTEKLTQIKAIGKMLFFDPILSGNGKRSCAGCHKPAEYFNDTTQITSLEFDGISHLARNTPTLVDAVYNHLLMLDGNHISLQNQAVDVITNPHEMCSDPQKVLENVMSCKIYKKAFENFKKLTPNYPDVTIDHIVSAITLYYSAFSNFSAPFDEAMNNKETISNESIKGFNLFMSKGQCATCHFVPQFNGVKPPYVSSEFEVLGVPDDTLYKKLSTDSGRYKMNPAPETMHAFRTGSIRNATYTKPYMHNGVFNSMDEVLAFYNAGGGSGRGLPVSNQTLSADSLHLTVDEIKCLQAFIKTLDETIPLETPPDKLPQTKLPLYQGRKVGGEY